MATEKTSVQEPMLVFDKIFKVEENHFCFNCGVKGAEWASPVFAVFFCINCAGKIRNLGTQVGRAVSVSMTKWTDEQLNIMALGGNPNYKKFLAQYHIGQQSSMELKYLSEASGYYRRMLSSIARKLPFNESPPGVAEGTRIADVTASRPVSSTEIFGGGNTQFAPSVGSGATNTYPTPSSSSGYNPYSNPSTGNGISPNSFGNSGQSFGSGGGNPAMMQGRTGFGASDFGLYEERNADDDNTWSSWFAKTGETLVGGINYAVSGVAEKVTGSGQTTNEYGTYNTGGHGSGSVAGAGANGAHTGVYGGGSGYTPGYGSSTTEPTRTYDGAGQTVLDAGRAVGGALASGTTAIWGYFKPKKDQLVSDQGFQAFTGGSGSSGYTGQPGYYQPPSVNDGVRNESESDYDNLNYIEDQHKKNTYNPSEGSFSNSLRPQNSQFGTQNRWGSHQLATENTAYSAATTSTSSAKVESPLSGFDAGNNWLTQNSTAENGSSSTTSTATSSQSPSTIQGASFLNNAGSGYQKATTNQIVVYENPNEVKDDIFNFDSKQTNEVTRNQGSTNAPDLMSGDHSATGGDLLTDNSNFKSGNLLDI
mmetsp:Transcript_43113/g.49547  ORF Transcript_43113/g.49547 Transcript_43113/m.49547 type:complete len:592 (+) Transcript_43113:263-2038(+)